MTTRIITCFEIPAIRHRHWCVLHQEPYFCYDDPEWNWLTCPSGCHTCFRLEQDYLTREFNQLKYEELFG